MDDEDPLDLARRVGGGLLLVATLVALVLWVAGFGPRMLQLLGVLWTLYGAYYAFLDGLLEPLIDGATGLLQNIGLIRGGGGYSGIETMVAQGQHEAAAEAYAVRAAEGRGDVVALVRRAALLAGPLGAAGQAALELEAARDRRRLPPEDDVRIGAALAHLYEGPLGEPGRAMSELRRLIDRYPAARDIRRLRRELDELRDARFGNRAEEAGR
jgi:hypothetical protein